MNHTGRKSYLSYATLGLVSFAMIAMISFGMLFYGNAVTQSSVEELHSEIATLQQEREELQITAAIPYRQRAAEYQELAADYQERVVELSVTVDALTNELRKAEQEILRSGASRLLKNWTMLAV